MLSRFTIVAVMAGCATAQNFTVAEFFNISSVSLTLRSSWCTSQSSVCSTLCGGATSANTCNTTDLSFSCLCQANNSAPGLDFYLNTIPSNECQSAFTTCIDDHPNDKTGQNLCTTDIQDTCGSLQSINMTFGSGSSTTASSSGATASPTTSGGSSSTSSSTATNAAALIGVGKDYSVGVVAAGIMAAFGFML